MSIDTTSPVPIPNPAVAQGTTDKAPARRSPRLHPGVATRRRPRTGAALDRRYTFSRLQGEWERLSLSSTAIDTARSWALGITIDTLDDVLGASGYGAVGRDAADDDPMLARLVTLARHDTLAARILLQRMMPGLAVIARRRSRDGGDEYQAGDDVLAAAWTVIRTYPVERRPRFIAVNLLRDADYYAFRRGFRRVDRDIPTASESFERTADDTVEAETMCSIADIVHLAVRAGVSDDDLNLVRRLAAGVRPEQIAAEMGVTDRTIRNYRRAMIERLRAVVAAGIEAGAI